MIIKTRPHIYEFAIGKPRNALQSLCAIMPIHENSSPIAKILSYICEIVRLNF